MAGTYLHVNFKLSASGENIFLVAPNLDFADAVVFGEVGDDQSYARPPNGTGSFSLQSPTFDAAN